ncbi:MAG TPA: glycerol-3-phosphate dehydrogenase/oxidase, partial [Nitrososphaerales archaeon]|nr:glycerol-3-phosphate dehydrogenase/oxidase [Nitrososphaerales archaeon]
LRIAPHLIRPLEFIVPNYNSSYYQRFRLKLGMIIYDWLSRGKSLPSHRMLSTEKICELERGLKLEGLKGGSLFYDCQASFVERIVIENAISACEKGAKIFTHTRVTGCEERQGISDKIVSVEDESSGEQFKLRCKILINASGPWADDVLRTLNPHQPANSERLRTTKGTHVVIPKLNQHAIILYAKSDGRLFFVIPWFQYTLIGTTDTDFSGNPAAVQPGTEDINYLLKESSEFIPGISEVNVLFTYAGVRPLVNKDPRKKESSISRDYQIIDHAREGWEGVISVLGVKISSYRIAAQDTTDLISKKLGHISKCTTDRESLPGGRGITSFEDFSRTNVERLKAHGLNETQSSYLLGIYGSRVTELIALMDSNQRNSERICPNNPDVVAQIVLAVNQEFAETLSDFFLRRTCIAFSRCRGLDCAGKVAEIMGDLLHWDQTEIAKQLEDYEKAVDLQLPIIQPPKT